MVVSCLSAFAIGIAACFLMAALPFILFVLVGVGIGVTLDAYQGGSLGSASIHGVLLLCATEFGYAIGLMTKLAGAHVRGRTTRPIVVSDAIHGAPVSRGDQPQARS